MRAEGEIVNRKLTAAEIGEIGERHVTAWLAAKGWTCYRNTQQSGATDILTTAGSPALLVQVKTALWPNVAGWPSAEERKAIVARANYNNREAWVAQLQINNDGALIGAIGWTKLN
jgi:Holliday junction resolvase-like predicted endonuclease